MRIVLKPIRVDGEPVLLVLRPRVAVFEGDAEVNVRVAETPRVRMRLDVLLPLVDGFLDGGEGLGCEFGLLFGSEHIVSCWLHPYMNKTRAKDRSGLGVDKKYFEGGAKQKWRRPRKIWGPCAGYRKNLVIEIK